MLSVDLAAIRPEVGLEAEDLMEAEFTGKPTAVICRWPYIVVGVAVREVVESRAQCTCRGH